MEAHKKDGSTKKGWKHTKRMEAHKKDESTQKEWKFPPFPLSLLLLSVQQLHVRKYSLAGEGWWGQTQNIIGQQ
jgi:hypothetical protein